MTVSTDRTPFWPALMGRSKRAMFRLMLASGFLWPLVRYCTGRIEEVSPSLSHKSLPTLRILALNPDRFRGDLEVLAASGQFRIFRAPFRFQTRLLGYFYPPGVRASIAHQNRDGREARDAFRLFLRPFLRQLYSAMRIDCVIGAGHYHQDVDWGAVSNEIGVPYIVIHRENLNASEAMREEVVRKGKSLGEFSGAHLFVHVESVRDTWIESGFVSPDKISALGALRMDAFVRRIGGKTRPTAECRRVTFFSFAPGASLLHLNIGPWPSDPDAGFVKFFRNSHIAFGEFAREHPDLDFVIKPKWGNHWISEIEMVLRQAGIPPDLSNLTIDATLDVHELILSSDVVLGFGSTALIEAAVAGKQVIIPFFDEPCEEQYADSVLLRDEFHLFDVARSPAEMKSLILQNLVAEVAPDLREARWDLFERYVSFADGTATEKYVDALTKLIAAHKQTALV